MDTQPRKLLSLVADLFGAAVTPVTIVVAILFFLVAWDDPSLNKGMVAAITCTTVIGLVLMVVGLWNRWRFGLVFREDRGSGSTILLGLGVLLVLGAVSAFLILR